MSSAQPESFRPVRPPAPSVRPLPWILGITSLLLLAAVIAYLSPLQPSVLALQFTFTPQSFQSVLDAWQSEGVFRFRVHLPVDYGLLVCYGAFGYVLATRTLVFSESSPLVRVWGRWSMPLAALSDGVENALHGYLTGHNVVQPAPVLYAVAGCSSVLKWALLVLFLVSVTRALLKPRPTTP